MKKNLFVVLLALTLAVPAFANQKGDMEILGKLGLTLTSKVDCSGSFVDEGGFSPTSFSGKSDTNMSFLITAEFFYYLNNSFAIGCGINNNFNADLKDTKEFKGEVGFTNFYLALKPKIELNSETFNSLYFIGQLGYGIFRFDSRNGKADGNGLYWGLGAGTEVMKNFIVELLYSFNYGSLKDKLGHGHTANLTYSTLSLNIGYKFAL